MAKFEVKELELVNAEGKRAVKVCNSVREQMFNKVQEVLVAEGFEVVKAANGELAIATAKDAATGEMYYTRLAVSFTNKALEAKIERKAKAKEKVDVALPVLFAEAETEEAE